jgi:hypothetical protein
MPRLADHGLYQTIVYHTREAQTPPSQDSRIPTGRRELRIQDTAVELHWPWAMMGDTLEPSLLKKIADGSCALSPV